MKKFLLLTFGLILVVFLVIPVNFTAFGEDPDLTQQTQRLLEIQQEQLKIQQELAKVFSQKKTLKNQIASFDNQISLTRLQIEETETRLATTTKKLEVLNSEIGDLTTKIDDLGASIDDLSVVLVERIKATYKTSNYPLLEAMMTSEDVTDYMGRLKYLQVVQAHDKKLLSQMQTAQASYKTEKSDLENKKVEVEALKKEIESEKIKLESQKAKLESQRADKQKLLVITQNDEARYQKILSEIRAEQSAIQSVISQFIKGSLPAGAAVNRGDVIGIQGSTGMSTGDHVHFGVYIKCGNNWCDTNPHPYLDSGQLSWPIDSHTISQEYGYTDFAQSSGFYANNFHNGLDMYGPSGSAVKAGADGKVSYSVDVYGGKGALVVHSDSLMTIYWHLQ
jgi:peptidoglycan hydrolase CwlO-like protein